MTQEQDVPLGSGGPLNPVRVEDRGTDQKIVILLIQSPTMQESQEVK